MTTKKVAIAIFVKTPGLSLVKTRLAAGVGRERAEEFYRLSLDCTREYVSEACRRDWRLRPYWAVAEDGTENQWTGFPVIRQGSGGLGVRLSRVYDELLKSHSWVFFIGADSPQLAPEVLMDTADSSFSLPDPFMLGPTDDGGFYLFGGSRPIPSSFWENVPYSQSDTAERLQRALEGLGRVRELKKSFDVDEVDDLDRLKRELTVQTSLLPAQRKLLTWLG